MRGGLSHLKRKQAALMLRSTNPLLLRKPHKRTQPAIKTAVYPLVSNHQLCDPALWKSISMCYTAKRHLGKEKMDEYRYG
jgi:hypothetical protein